MSKLQAPNKTVIQPEVPNLIHDIILSLCQRKYSSVSNVEVDGIICISFKGLSEQQVIKIHENLQSPQKPPATEKEDGSTSHTDTLDLNLEVENIVEKDNPCPDDGIDDHMIEKQNEVDNGETNNFRNDISFLSSLLKTTNDMIGSEDNVAEKKKKKNKGGKQDLNKVSRRKRKHPMHHRKGQEGSPKKAYTDDSFTDRTESNDFSNEPVHEKLVVVKQEVLDDYEETNPKIVNVFSACDAHLETNPKTVNCQTHLGTEQNQNNEIDHRPEQVLLYQSLGLRRSESAERPPSQESSAPSEDNNQNLNIVIKEEKMDDGEFGAAYGDHIGSHGNWENEINAGDYYSVGDPDYVPCADELAQGYSSSDRAGSKSSATVIKKKKYKTKKDDNANKNWFETVKNNMNRYQAALLKSVQITKKGAGANKPREFLDGRESVERNDAGILKAILEGGVDKETPERDSLASPTSSAIVKKENEQENKTGEESKTVEPKLVSKYPALFNQLQKSSVDEKQGEENPVANLHLHGDRPGDHHGDVASQQDSLVNRLPFLSFKDLFAQASPNGSTAGIDMRPSPERLADLLSQPAAKGRSQTAQGKLSDVGEGATGIAKKTWNWKKRAVRPKGPNGEILTNRLPRVGDLNKQDIPIGIANPKRQKPKSKNDDKDWHPHHTDMEVLSQVREGVSTRRSSGRSRRTNFTEFTDSDLEEIELEEDEAESQVELVSAYCNFNCGAMFQTVSDLKAHEETCGERGFTCDYCGLDFNQQYRWQYHMIKVHGVSANSGMFR